MDRLYLAKHRDTFHFRGTLKKLGLKFDGERRLWYAETQEQLNEALKLLQKPPEPPSPVSGQPAKGDAEGAQPVAGGSAAGSGEQGDGEGDGAGEGDGDGDGPAPFATFAETMSKTMNMPAAAATADEVLGKQLAKLAKASGKQEAQKQAQQMQKEMQQKLDKALDEAKALAGDTPKKIAIQVKEKAPVVIDGANPDWIQDVVAMLSMTPPLNVRLVGPAGSGKSHGAKVAAEEVLKRRFGFVNFSDGVDESHLYGFRDITDGGTKYVVPELSFADLFEHGGVWLGDEYDRGNPNVVVSLNGALANGHLSLPKRKGATIAPRHPDFGAIVTMNTWGTGPSAQYSSANRLDESSLDRFRMGTIYVDYNRKLEAALLPDKVLLQRIWKLRDKVFALGLQRVISTRFIADAARVQAELDWTHDRIMGQAVLGWSEHDKQKVGEL